MMDLWQYLTNNTTFQGYDNETLMDLFKKITNNNNTYTLDHLEAADEEKVTNKEKNNMDSLLREEDNTENDADNDDASHIPPAEGPNEEEAVRGTDLYDDETSHDVLAKTSHKFEVETNKESFEKNEDEILLDIWQQLTNKVVYEEDAEEIMKDLWK